MDKKIIEQLKSLKKISPSDQWKKESFSVILKEINDYKNEKNQSKFFMRIKAFREFLHEIPFQIAPLFMLVLFFVAGGAAVVHTAYSSLPGHFLYPFKINIEKAQLAFLANDSKKAELNIQFANNRVHEIDQIIGYSVKNSEKGVRVNSVVKTLKANINSVKEKIREGGSFGYSNFKIALSLASTTSEIDETLKKSKDILSDEVKNTLKEARDSAEEAGITALVKTLEVKQNSVSTSTVIIIDDTAGQKTEAANILKDKVSKLEIQAKSLIDEFTNLSKTNHKVTEDDITTMKDIYVVIIKLISESNIELEKENYTKISENIALIKNLINKMETIIGKYNAVEAQVIESKVKDEDKNPADNINIDTVPISVPAEDQ